MKSPIHTSSPNTSNNKYWTERRERLTPDYRLAWERDYARIVHSAACRRLQAKTQVLGVGHGDFHRTRLTHSLEVSQIGVSITKFLYREAEKNKMGGELNRCAMDVLPPPMLVRAICMAHDLGHPPFGHGGEIALNRCMLKYGGFEGNGQTLRNISRLEKYHKKYGMNLTRRTVLGVIKYPAPYSEVVNWHYYPKVKYSRVNEQSTKILTPKVTLFEATKFKPPKCYLDDEHEDIVLNWVAKELDDWDEIRRKRMCQKEEAAHGKTKYKSLDASIMDIADDIAYGIHDLEDAIGLELIKRHDFIDWFEKSNCEVSHKDCLRKLLKHLGDMDFSDLVNSLFDGGTLSRKTMIGKIVGFCVENVEFVKKYPEFKEPLFQHQVEFKKMAGAKQALCAFKQIVVDLVIKSPEVQQLEFKGQKIITDLFRAFATDPKRLLDKKIYQDISSSGKTPQNIARGVCDYIAGMTDDYATTRHQQLFEPGFGSVFDKL